jgi:hypothetical protein
MSTMPARFDESLCCRPLEGSLLFQAGRICAQRLRGDAPAHAHACRVALHAATEQLPAELAGGAEAEAVVRGVLEAAQLAAGLAAR